MNQADRDRLVALKKAKKKLITQKEAAPRTQKCSPVKFHSLLHKRAIAMALFPFRNPITEATGCLGGIAMHMCT
jgi:hypothetical protein